MLNKNIYQTFYALLAKDIAIYNKRWWSRSIDALVWACSSLIVAHYMMPLFGITDPQYGTFVLVGNLAIWGLFEMLTSIAVFLGDIQGDKAIGYYMSLPLPSSMVFIEQALASAYRSIASSILIFPAGKLILGNNLHLNNVSWLYLIIAFIIINIFYGFFTILVAGYIKDLSALTMVRSRIIFPLWFLGCFQFTWKMLYKVAPNIAYISLCNPMVYIMDGMRATVLPAEQYLSFWNCMIMIILFSIVCGYFGIQKLQRRLDCI
ncbi:MAG: ABC transporter permease [Candidatus Chromulinivorax sp.]|nr:ABC transporter permease [Candidatus Chromulinivorax sp.]